MVSGGEKSGEYDPVMRELAEAQFALFAYICALAGHAQDARDILQETNLRLCRESSRYDRSKPFLPWAKAIAFYEVKTFRKKQTRDRLVFGDDVLETVAAQADRESEQTERALTVLEACVRKLPDLLRRVVEAHYFKGVPVQEVARRIGRSPNAVSLLLMRTRQALSLCVRRVAADEGGAK